MLCFVDGCGLFSWFVFTIGLTDRLYVRIILDLGLLYFDLVFLLLLGACVCGLCACVLGFLC